MEATIVIEELRLRGHHGVLEQERAVGNDFAFTLRLRYAADRAVATDDISAALNYADVVEVVKRENEIPSKLLEHLAVRIRNAVKEHFPVVTDVAVKVTKLLPPIPGVQLAGISVEIGR